MTTIHLYSSPPIKYFLQFILYIILLPYLKFSKYKYACSTYGANLTAYFFFRGGGGCEVWLRPPIDLNYFFYDWQKYPNLSLKYPHIYRYIYIHICSFFSYLKLFFMSGRLRWKKKDRKKSLMLFFGQINFYLAKYIYLEKNIFSIFGKLKQEHINVIFNSSKLFGVLSVLPKSQT